MTPLDVEKVRFDENGLVPAIVQDVQGDVLMLAFMNKESLTKSIQERKTFFWSRSRKSLWHKGETSGNTQRIVGISLDCDSDSLLLRVEQTGSACHTGSYSCFDDSAVAPGESASLGRVIPALYAVILDRKEAYPEGSYTARLFKGGLDRILKKIGEEAGETIIAAKNHDQDEIANEVADLIYHILVMMANEGVTPEAVSKVLASRKTIAPSKK